jgi:hypothetical protein
MKDIKNAAPNSEGPTASLDNDVHAAVLPLVRLLARQAAREDFQCALEGARMKPYSTECVRGAPKTIEDT